MKLQEIFDQLTTGEFSQISLGGQQAGVINELNRGKVMNHLNLGLTALYSRFTLKENSIKLQLIPLVDTYVITSNYAVNARKARADVRYLIDTPEMPFADDIVKFKKVQTEEGVDLDLNNHGNRLSVFTPSATTVKVPRGMVTGDQNLPASMRTDSLTLTYQASHPFLAEGIGFFDPKRLDVELPPTHLTALLWFVASRAHNPIGMGQEFNSGNTYYAKYENECARLEGNGLDVDQDSDSDRLERNGWI